MNYAAIRNYDIANGEGVRVSLFVSGCTNHCPGCFNPKEQDFSYGEVYTKQTERTILNLVSNPVISGLSLLGGDPLCQDEEGLWDLNVLCYKVKRLNKTIWLWTGFELEKIYRDKGNDILTDLKCSILKKCDVVVDGPFKQELSNRVLKWCGSSNQRVIDVQKSLKESQIVLWE